ncbi:MAG: hypothetical protein V2A73_14560 [Pseudomonadota bacterium]
MSSHRPFATIPSAPHSSLHQAQLHLHFSGWWRWEGSLAAAAPIPTKGIEEGIAGTSTNGLVHQVNTSLGVLVGYKRVFVGFELNVVRYWFSLDVLTKPEEHSGFVIYPAASLLVEI